MKEYVLKSISPKADAPRSAKEALSPTAGHGTVVIAAGASSSASSASSVPGKGEIDYGNSLNPEQLEVVTCQGGPMLVLAGAGTGKTRTITYRVAWLIERGVHPSNLLLLTFTNKAAREMMARAEALTGAGVRGVWGGTFHYVCNAILKRHAHLIGYKEGFTIMDGSDTKDLFALAMRQCKTKSASSSASSSAMMPKASVVAAICSFMKNTSSNLNALLNGRYYAYKPWEEEIGRVIETYEKKKIELNYMDFDDLLVNLVRLFEENAHVREHYSGRFSHILVDEYQDTNTLQGRIIDILSSSHGNVMVVGDDAQAIFSFRGANFDNILNFTSKYPDASLFKLTTNYRSTPQILNLANEAIGRNVRQYQKRLAGARPDGPKPVVVFPGDAYEQASFVGARIRDAVKRGLCLTDVAVLYRSNYQSMEIQMELQRMGIPYEVRSGLKFFEQAHVKDVMSFLRLRANPFDELSWKRVLTMVPKVGNATADKVWNAISREANPMSALKNAESSIPKGAREDFNSFVSLFGQLQKADRPPDVIDTVISGAYYDYLVKTYSNFADRAKDLEQMSEYSQIYSSIDEFVNDMSLDSSNYGGHGEEPADKGKAVLTSIHQAKGLEWKVVFIIGLNDGQFPSKKALDADDGEEERRLFYVAVTRACDELYLCSPEHLRGSYAVPSRFIDELEEDLYERMNGVYE